MKIRLVAVARLSKSTICLYFTIAYWHFRDRPHRRSPLLARQRINLTRSQILPLTFSSSKAASSLNTATENRADITHGTKH
jgi:hypothetical protein